jgi:hypothetical protein
LFFSCGEGVTVCGGVDTKCVGVAVSACLEPGLDLVFDRIVKVHVDLAYEGSILIFLLLLLPLFCLGLLILHKCSGRDLKFASGLLAYFHRVIVLARLHIAEPRGRLRKHEVFCHGCMRYV